MWALSSEACIPLMVVVRVTAGLRIPASPSQVGVSVAGVMWMVTTTVPGEEFECEASWSMVWKVASFWWREYMFLPVVFGSVAPALGLGVGGSSLLVTLVVRMRGSEQGNVPPGVGEGSATVTSTGIAASLGDGCEWGCWLPLSCTVVAVATPVSAVEVHWHGHPCQIQGVGGGCNDPAIHHPVCLSLSPSWGGQLHRCSACIDVVATLGLGCQRDAGCEVVLKSIYSALLVSNLLACQASPGPLGSFLR